MGLIVLDETEKTHDRRFVRLLERYFQETATGRYRSTRIVPSPFFVASDMAYPMQVAGRSDLFAELGISPATVGNECSDAPGTRRGIRGFNRISPVPGRGLARREDVPHIRYRICSRHLHSPHVSEKSGDNAFAANSRSCQPLGRISDKRFDPVIRIRQAATIIAIRDEEKTDAVQFSPALTDEER